MIMESQNQQPAVNVYPGGGNFGGYGGDMFGNNSAWWIIILFLFAMMGGWGNNGNGAAYIPYAGQNSVQQGFDQAAIIGGINDVQNSLVNLGTAMQSSCCDNRVGIADLKYSIATEACADRAAVTEALQNVTVQNTANTNALMTAMNAGFQSIKDQMCQDKIDAKNEEIANLRSQLAMMNFAASQNTQTAAILANNEAQTTALEQYLSPVPRPAYIVQNPNCCGTNYYTACGCANA